MQSPRHLSQAGEQSFPVSTGAAASAVPTGAAASAVSTGAAASDSCSARGWTSPRPCEHNEWDNVRMKHYVSCLRCRVCQGVWHVHYTKRQRCGAFDKGRCQHGSRCPQLHIYRRKLRLEERQAMFGSELITGYTSRAPAQAEQHVLDQQEEYAGTLPAAGGGAAQVDASAAGPAAPVPMHEGGPAGATANLPVAAVVHMHLPEPAAAAPAPPLAAEYVPAEAQATTSRTSNPSTLMDNPVQFDYMSTPADMYHQPWQQSQAPFPLPETQPLATQLPPQPLILPAVAVVVSGTAGQHAPPAVASPPPPAPHFQQVYDAAYQQGFAHGHQQQAYQTFPNQPQCHDQSAAQCGGSPYYAAPPPPQQQQQQQWPLSSGVEGTMLTQPPAGQMTYVG
eukprot:TRINITY_DN1798_c0_g3_i2.p1 TRINITY_DN1798_c0_g3~~TRINITY_DN1798_c0_g3_i2.p1  ORF type:complete len:393 (+),score=48.84 TRINITY_DN1798_c0_g3_i2:106-1284(+)